MKPKKMKDEEGGRSIACPHKVGPIIYYLFITLHEPIHCVPMCVLLLLSLIASYYNDVIIFPGLYQNVPRQFCNAKTFTYSWA